MKIEHKKTLLNFQLPTITYILQNLNYTPHDGMQTPPFSIYNIK
jgi:hypothetical protein